MRVGSISADPGQFLFRSVERAGNFLSEGNGNGNGKWNILIMHLVFILF